MEKENEVPVLGKKRKKTENRIFYVALFIAAVGMVWGLWSIRTPSEVSQAVSLVEDIGAFREKAQYLGKKDSVYVYTYKGREFRFLNTKGIFLCALDSNKTYMYRLDEDNLCMEVINSKDASQHEIFRFNRRKDFDNVSYTCFFGGASKVVLSKDSALSAVKRNTLFWKRVLK
jgi:hypothetical protein